MLCAQKYWQLLFCIIFTRMFVSFQDKGQYCMLVTGQVCYQLPYKRLGFPKFGFPRLWHKASAHTASTVATLHCPTGLRLREPKQTWIVGCLLCRVQVLCLWLRCFLYFTSIYEIVAVWVVSLQVGWNLRLFTVLNIACWVCLLY